jgi:hypothetical protein
VEQRIVFVCEGATPNVEGVCYVFGQCRLGPIRVGDRFRSMAAGVGPDLPVDFEVVGVVNAAGSNAGQLDPGSSGRIGLSPGTLGSDVSGVLLSG